MLHTRRIHNKQSNVDIVTNEIEAEDDITPHMAACFPFY